MDKIMLYDFSGQSFSIIPQEQKVSDSDRVKKSAIPEAMKGLVVGIIMLIVWGVAIYFIGEIIDKNMEDSGFKKILGAGLVGSIFGPLFIIWLKIKALLVSLFKPNLTTPEKALKSYLAALEKGLYERAYNLLTDNAQNIGKLDFPKEDIMQKRMPDLYFEDLTTFNLFWNGIEFPWKQPDFNQPKAELIDDETAIVETEIQLDPSRLKVEQGEYYFPAKFIAVRRDNLWFIANGFFWPQKETS